MNPDKKRAVTEALIEEHRDLYLNNATFKYSLDTFIEWLPVLVEGLAARGREAAADFDERLLESIHATRDTRWLTSSDD